MGTDKAGLKHKSDFDNQASTLSQFVLHSDLELSQTGKRGNGGGGGSTTEQPVQSRSPHQQTSTVCTALGHNFDTLK